MNIDGFYEMGYKIEQVSATGFYARDKDATVTIGFNSEIEDSTVERHALLAREISDRIFDLREKIEDFVNGDEEENLTKEEGEELETLKLMGNILK